MVSSAQPSAFSTKQLLLTALVALAAGSAQAAGAKNVTSAVNHATFGRITSGSGKCITADPTTGVTRKDVNWVWENTIAKEVSDFNNLIFDQIVNNKGHLNYCVRWDTNKKLTKAAASKFQAMLERQINVWNRWLAGYDCWPYDKINISVVGFAVRDKSIMDWDDDSLGTIYEGILDDEGSPKCPDECYKHQYQAASSDTSGCKSKPFDMSLWPTARPGDNPDDTTALDADAVGTGGDWGQRVWVVDMLNKMDQAEMDVILHEMGHGFGLPEMYAAENKPAGYPTCVMDEAFALTDGDGWLLRSILENIKSRYKF